MYNKKILVTGVLGQLGYDVVRELKKREYKNVLGIDINDLDITDYDACISFITNYKPDIIIHPAAFTKVDLAEEKKEECFNVNAIGTKNIALAAKMVDAKLLYISTDYVFDGEGNNYFEVDSIKGGLSVYGRSKSLGEDYVKEILEKYFIIRISWVFGINGKNFVTTMLSLAEKGYKELNVVNDQIGSPTYTHDLSILLCDMMNTDKYGIYHATNEGLCSFYEFAVEIFKKSNISIKVNPVSTKEYQALVKNQANRPLNSRLSKKSLDEASFNRLPDWKDALDRFLIELKEV